MRWSPSPADDRFLVFSVMSVLTWESDTVILLKARHHLGLWTELLGAGGWRSIFGKAAQCLLCALVPWATAVGPGERRGSELGDLWSSPLTAVSAEKPLSSVCLSWSCRPNSSLLLWFKSDVKCLLNKAVMAAQMENRGGLLLLLPFWRRMRELDKNTQVEQK